MKKSIVLIAMFTGLGFSLAGQSPETLNYQAVALDRNGDVLALEKLTVRVTILQNNELIWEEDHEVTTNEAGFFNIAIGHEEATKVMGDLNSFSEINWSVGNTQYKVALDDGSGFEELGTHDFRAVPYALYAASGPPGNGSDNQELELQGSTLSITNGNSVDLSGLPGGVGGEGLWTPATDTLSTMKHVGIGTNTPMQSALAVQGYNVHPEAPLFEVRREDGFPVFAVYNDGVMVYVDEETKGRRGGFAVGGYNRKAKGLSQEYLSVSPDSVRIYVPEDEVAKGRRGSFAVGSYSRKAKSYSQDFLNISADSVRIYVPENTEAKGRRGSFAVGSYSRKAKGSEQDFFYVNPDSTRVYVPNKGNDPGFGGILQGGFAVNGYSGGATGEDQYLMGINQGITRFFTTDSDEGFAIGSPEDGYNYMKLTTTNSFIGADAGLNNEDVLIDEDQGWEFSVYNVFMGYQSGMENRYGHHNTFLGFCAGTNTTGIFEDTEAGAHNIFVGSQAGFDNTIGSYNVYLGHHAGMHNVDGYDNVFIGTNAGAVGLHTHSCTMVGTDAGREYTGAGEVVFMGQWAGNNNSGRRNTYLGSSAGADTGDGNQNVGVGWRAGINVSGDNNVILGNEAGRGNSSGSEASNNVLVGHNAGYRITAGNGNVALGFQSGFNNEGGFRNVFLGNRAGYDETGSNQLYIANSETFYPLIWGNFQSQNAIVYGDLEVAGTFFETSDAHMKTNIQDLDRSLDKLMSLRGVSFQWKEGDGSKGHFSPGSKAQGASKTSLGVLAQDVEQVFPELVRESRGGEKAVNYTGLIPVLIESVKEQQEVIAAQQALIEALEVRLLKLESQ